MRRLCALLPGLLAIALLAACSAKSGNAGTADVLTDSQDAALADADATAGDGAVDVPDTGPALQDAADAQPTDTPQLPDVPDAVAACPASIQPGASCSASGQVCKIGKECCCGECFDSLVCSCGGGTWNCYYTDACMIPACPDASDAGPDMDATLDADFAVPWTLFSVQKGYGPCPPGQICSASWTLATDGLITMKKSGVSSTAQMASGEFAAFASALGGQAFLASMKNGFVCDVPPTDIGISFQLSLSGVQYSQDVTGCALSGGQDGPTVKALHDVLTKY